MTQNRYTCPVCGFDDLKEPPISTHQEPSYEICPCCGFEFGFDDAHHTSTFDTYRTSWINRGALWFQPERKPGNWGLKRQLKNIGL